MKGMRHFSPPPQKKEISLNIERYGSKTCVSCRTSLMLLSFVGYEWRVFYSWGDPAKYKPPERRGISTLT